LKQKLKAHKKTMKQLVNLVIAKEMVLSNKGVTLSFSHPFYDFRFLLVFHTK